MRKHDRDSLLATALMWVKRAPLFEQLDHDAPNYKEFVYWRNVYDELTAA